MISSETHHLIARCECGVTLWKEHKPEPTGPKNLGPCPRCRKPLFPVTSSADAPINPGDTRALAKVAYDQLTHYGVSFEMRTEADLMRYYRIANAVARAVCPEDSVVVRRDDLVRVCDLAESMTCDDLAEIDEVLVDGLRAIAGKD